MYWEEDSGEEQFLVPDNVVDLLFQIDCPTLPVDHAWDLSEEIQKRLPWFAHEPEAGLHLIHGAESGNGWERPQGVDDILHLSRRVKLILRIPKHRIEASKLLCGEILSIGGHRLAVGEPKTRRLSMTHFLYSRYIATDEHRDEDQFMAWAVEQLQSMGLKFRKVLTGKDFQFASPKGELHARSLMVADLPYDDAVELQERGIGPHRQMGFGIFIPQKSF